MIKKDLLERKEIFQIILSILFFVIVFNLPWKEITFSTINSEFKINDKSFLIPISIIPFVVLGNMIPRTNIKEFFWLVLFTFSSVGLSNIVIMITPRVFGLKINKLNQFALILSYILYEFNIFRSPLCSVIILMLVMSYELFKSRVYTNKELLFWFMVFVQVFLMSEPININAYIAYFFMALSLVSVCIGMNSEYKNPISRTELFLSFSLILLNSNNYIVATVFILTLALIPYPESLKKNLEETGTMTVLAIIYIFVHLLFVKSQTEYYTLLLLILVMIKSKDLIYKFRIISSCNRLSTLMMVIFSFGLLEYLVGLR